MAYIGWDNREYEDPEMDAMREDALEERKRRAAALHLRSLNELAPVFNDVQAAAPYLWAEVQVTVKIFINHPDMDETGLVSQDCTVQIEAPGPSRLADDEDPALVAMMEKNVIGVLPGGEVATPEIALDDVIKAFNLDRDSSIWHLEYE